MKAIIAITLSLIVPTAWACMPKGEKLSASEERVFLRTLTASKPACARQINAQIGRVPSAQVSVYEELTAAMSKYTVIGAHKQMQILRRGRPLTFSCQPVTAKPRGC
jgi:hypothetical protein